MALNPVTFHIVGQLLNTSVMVARPGGGFTFKGGHYKRTLTWNGHTYDIQIKEFTGAELLSILGDRQAVAAVPSRMGMRWECLLVMSSTQPPTGPACTSPPRDMQFLEAAYRTALMVWCHNVPWWNDTVHIHQPYPRHGGGITRSTALSKWNWTWMRPAQINPTDYATFHALVDFYKDTPQDQFGNVLSLATNCFDQAGRVLDDKLSFLMLMVGMEALMKPSDDKFKLAGKRISWVLADTKAQRNTLVKAFNEDPDCYRDLRNRVAHGDPALDGIIISTNQFTQDVSAQVRRAAVRLILEYQANPPGQGQDYYNWLKGYVDRRIQALPPR